MNNVEKYDKELREYTMNSIAHAKYDEWHWKYLKERLTAEQYRVKVEELERQNEILRNRLFMCKKDNRVDKQKMVSAIKILAHDPDDSLQIRKPSDICWDVDKHIGMLIVDLLKHFKKNSIGIPSNIMQEYEDDEQKAREAWEQIIDTIAEAFIIESTTEAFDLSDEEKETVDKGKRLFIQYYSSLWN